MTKNLLHISASPLGENSTSLAIASEFAASYAASNPGARVDHWDLWDGTLPEFDLLAVQSRLALFYGNEHTEEQAATWQRVLDTFNRFDAYDRILISTPMWNSGIPYKLKQFIDVVSQLGTVFRINPETGYEHLLSGRGKKAAVVYTSAVWGPGVGPNWGSDHQSPYLDDWLRWTGIEDIDSIRYHPTLAGDAEAAELAATATARKIAATF